MPNGDIQQALFDFDATIKEKPNLSEAELLKKFPEFGNDKNKLQSAFDYSATLNSGKYKEPKEFNSKFPEFFGGGVIQQPKEQEYKPKTERLEDMFPIQETTMGGKVKLATKEPKESTSTIFKQEAVNKEEALSNRKKNLDNIDNALTEHAKKVSASKGIKNPSKQDIDFEKDFAKKQIDNGTLSLNRKLDGSYDIGRRAGFIETLVDNVNQNYLTRQQDNYFNSLSKEDKVKYIKEHPNNYDPQFDAQVGKKDKSWARWIDENIIEPFLPDNAKSALSSTGKVIGENLPLLAEIGAASVIGEALGGTKIASSLAKESLPLVKKGIQSTAQFLAQVNSSLQSSVANTTIDTYNKLKQQNPNMPDLEAIDKASNASIVPAAVSIGTSAFFSDANAPTEEMNNAYQGVAKSLKAHAEHVLKTSPKVVAAFSGGQFLTDLSKIAAGQKMSLDEISSNQFDAAKQGAVMHFGYGLLTGGGIAGAHLISEYIPKYLQSQIKNYVASAPREAVMNDLNKLEKDGVIEKGGADKAAAELDKWDEKKDITKDLPLPEEHKAAITGLLVKKDNINDAIKKFQENPEAFKPQIVKLEEQGKSVDNKIADIQNSDTFLQHETDNFTAEPAMPKAEVKADDVKVTPTIVVDGKEYYGEDHGEAMKAAIADGKDIPSPDTEEGQKWREKNGQFKTSDGELIPRSEAQDKLGFSQSEDIPKERLEVPKDSGKEVATPKELSKQSSNIKDILGLSNEDADALSFIYNSKLNPNEKKILYRQFKRGVMSMEDIKKYTTIDLEKLSNKGIDKWAKILLEKNRGNKINAENIDFEEVKKEPEPTAEEIAPKAQAIDDVVSGKAEDIPDHTEQEVEQELNDIYEERNNRQDKGADKGGETPTSGEVSKAGEPTESDVAAAKSELEKRGGYDYKSERIEKYGETEEEYIQRKHCQNL